jgi:small subunit ribosomal protein S2
MYQSLNWLHGSVKGYRGKTKTKHIIARSKTMVTMKDLLECGVHFGHQTRRWNPKMKKFIFGVRKNIYIIDLQKTLRYFRYTYTVVRDRAAAGETMIFVGTKKQASETVKQAAISCGMPYVNYRWLGGMLTNYGTIKKSIRKLEVIKKMKEEGQTSLLTKKEALMLDRKEEKLELYLGGIKDMKQLPDMMFVIDAAKEKIAIAEARRLGIKVIAPIDTNCDPDVIDYPIPGNDDAIRSIQLFCSEMAEAMNEGRAAFLENGGTIESAPVSAEEAQEVLEEALAESEDLTEEDFSQEN